MEPFTAKRILVVGCPGAGKSTFARKLRDATGLPLYYLDMLYHHPDRTTAPREEFDAALTKILSQDEWIIDGCYLRTLPIRLERAELVFFLDYPQEVCLAGAASRIGHPREDMPWIESEFDPEFRQYIIDYSVDQLPRMRTLLSQAQSQGSIDIITFTTREEADSFITSFLTRH